MLEFLTWWSFWGVITSLPLLYWYFNRHFDYFTKRRIKGPKPTVFFGNFIEESTNNRIHLEEKWAKLYGKVYGHFRGRKPILKITDPDLIKQILVKDFNKFADREGFGNVEHEILDLNLSQVNGDQWKRIRTLVSPTFTTGKMKKMFPMVKESIKVLLDAFDKRSNGKGEVDVKNTFGGFTMEVIGSCAFATNTNILENPNHPFLINAQRMFNVRLFPALASFLFPLWLNNMIGNTGLFDHQATDYFIKLCRHIIRERRNKNNGKKYNDFLQLIMDAETTDEDYRDEEDKLDAHHINEGEEEINAEKKFLFSGKMSKKLSEDEMIAQAVLFFVAGYETTATLLTWASYELALNTSIQERLYEEIRTAINTKGDIDYDLLSRLPFLDSVISETLRLHSPAVVLNRLCIEDCRLNSGLKIEKGQELEISVHPVHYSEDYYPEPYKFKPDRFMPENRHLILPYTYIPFGVGPRNCVGMRFALMEAKIALAYVVNHYRFVRTANTAVPPVVGNFVVVNAPKSLLLGVEKR